MCFSIIQLFNFAERRSYEDENESAIVVTAHYLKTLTILAFPTDTNTIMVKAYQ